MKARKRPGGIRTIPAGTEISVRTAGTMRPKNTARPPCRANQPCALSMSPGDTVIQRPCLAAHRFSRSDPTERPSQNQKLVPRTDPSVPASTVGMKDSAPVPHRYPASGMMTSDGIGGKMFSSSMSAKMPG